MLESILTIASIALGVFMLIGFNALLLSNDDLYGHYDPDECPHGFHVDICNVCNKEDQ